MQTKEPGDIVQIDSLHLMEGSTKLYFITAIDIFGRKVYVSEYKTLNGDNAKDFMIKLRRNFKYKIKRRQTGNRLEFYKHFDKYLAKENIAHFWNYPRSPKSNAYINAYQGDLTDIETGRAKIK